MRKISAKEIVEVLGGTLYGDREAAFTSVSIDTRKVTEGSCYIGFRGERVDGNDLYQDALRNGASLCIIEKEPEEVPEGAAVIRVGSTYQAILDLASYYRQSLRVKIIGVTGSTGKTSTKDILHGMLSERFSVFKTSGNYNNEIGLPLMIFSLDDAYDYAILEMGMSALLEIHNLAKVARPDIAIITNIGVSHVESLGSRENILKAKMEIADFFTPESLLVLNADDAYLDTVGGKPYRIVRGGIGKGDVKAEILELNRDSVAFTVNGKDAIRINIPGRHNVQNAVLCYIVCRELGMADEDLHDVHVTKSSMRMDVMELRRLTLINDCYNASPDSMKSGIDYLMSFPGRKVALLGTMRELGDETVNAHISVGRYAKEKGVDMLIAVGDYTEAFRHGFGAGDFHGFQTFEAAAPELRSLLLPKDTVLLKASRGMAFERFIPVLDEFGGE